MIFPFPQKEKSVPIPAISGHSWASDLFTPPFMRVDSPPRYDLLSFTMR